MFEGIQYLMQLYQKNLTQKKFVSNAKKEKKKSIELLINFKIIPL